MWSLYLLKNVLVHFYIHVRVVLKDMAMRFVEVISVSLVNAVGDESPIVMHLLIFDLVQDIYLS